MRRQCVREWNSSKNLWPLAQSWNLHELWCHRYTQAAPETAEWRWLNLAVSLIVIVCPPSASHHIKLSQGVQFRKIEISVRASYTCHATMNCNGLQLSETLISVTRCLLQIWSYFFYAREIKMGLTDCSLHSAFISLRVRKYICMCM